MNMFGMLHKIIYPKLTNYSGKMTKFDWGFLEYKHLHHHLKQFNV